MTTEDGPVEVYAASNMAEAQFVHNLLAEAGVPAEIVGEAMTGVTGQTINDSTPRIWVRAENEARARPVIEEFQQRLIDRGEGRPDEPLVKEPYCYHCGQEVQRGQSPCPACGKELDWASSDETEAE